MKEKIFKEWILNQFLNFEKKLNGKAESELHDYRKNAAANFLSLPFPSKKDEEWKYTNVLGILDYNFSLPSKNAEISKEKFADILFTNNEDYYNVIFVNGVFVPHLSNLPEVNSGLNLERINSLSGASKILFHNALKKSASGENIFTELNSAFIDDGLFIHAEKGRAIDKPVHIVYYTEGGDAPILTNPRNFFVVEENARLKIVETYFSNSNAVYLTNAFSEIHAHDGGHLEHVKIQRECENAFHISSLFAQIERSANYMNFNINLGGKIIRNNLNAKFNAEGSEATLNGLFLGNKEQLIDNHTEIEHAMPNCVSHELYKGVLDDKSRGVFNGKIFVRKDAQKTNAFQENKTILLSNDSRIDAKPQLEIFADDVKCTHGATVGQLDKDALFYLKTRGFSEEAARATLIYAFASDAVHSISITEVRDSIERLIAEKLHYQD